MLVQKFKKTGSVILCMLMLITMWPNLNLVQVKAEVVYGDLDGNKKVDAIDFATFRMHLLGIKKLETNAMKVADLNMDDSVNSIDFAIMRQFILGQIHSLPLGNNITPTPTSTFSAKPSPTQAASTALPTKEEVLEKMVLANNYFLSKYPSPGAKADATHDGNIWTKSTYLQGLLALYRTNNDASLYKYAVDWAEYFDWSAPGGNKTYNADNQCCMQTYIDLYQIEPDSVKIKNTTECMDYMLQSASAMHWSWIDALFMAMPVFIDYASVKDDKFYRIMAHSYYTYTKKSLYNEFKGLWWRDSNFRYGDVYWSRGNGWVFAAHAKVLSILPETDPNYNEYKTTFMEMAAALKKCQRSDGFWNPDLLNPDNYGGKETTGTALFTYGMAWGINAGILDSDIYLPCVLKGWNGMEKDALHDNGFIGWVQGTGKQPSDGQPLSYDKIPNFEDFGLGAFLLAGSEVYKLADK